MHPHYDKYALNIYLNYTRIAYGARVMQSGAPHLSDKEKELTLFDPLNKILNITLHRHFGTILWLSITHVLSF